LPTALRKVLRARIAGSAERLRRLGGVDARRGARGDRGERQDVAQFDEVVGQDGRAASGLGLRPEAGLMLAQRTVERKSNEITGIPEVLDMIASRPQGRDRHDHSTAPKSFAAITAPRIDKKSDVTSTR